MLPLAVFACMFMTAVAFRDAPSILDSLEPDDRGPPPRKGAAGAARSALLTVCTAGGARYFPRSEDQLFDGLDALLFSFKAAVGGDSFVFTLPETGAATGRTIHSIAGLHGAKVWEVKNATDYHGYSNISLGSTVRHVHYLEWVAAYGHAYDRVFVADCIDVAFQSDPFLAEPVARHPAEVYLFLEPVKEKAYKYFQRHAKLCYSLEFERFVTPELQVNSGVWMGTPRGIALVSELVMLEALHCDHHLWDQHYLNVAVAARLQGDPRVRLLAEESAVATMAKNVNASAFEIDGSFAVGRAAGEGGGGGPYCVLHQYNWHQHLVFAVRARKAAQELPPRPARRPKIYVYRGADAVNARLREAFLPTIEASAWRTVHSEYVAEVRLHEGLLESKEWLTTDPDDADLFFVPGYYWLALQCQTKEVKPTGTGVDACALRRALAEQTVEMLKGSRAWQLKKPHVFVHGSSRTLEEVFPGGLAELVAAPHSIVAAVGGGGGDTREHRYSFKPHDIVIPYVIPAAHVAHIEARLLGAWNAGRWKPLKLSMHASPNHPIRQRLGEIFAADRAFNASQAVSMRKKALAAEFSKSTIQAALDDAVDATFCLAPRGLTAGARRLYEAILAVCIPVAVGDRLTAAETDVLPELEKVIVYWPEAQIEDLPAYLHSLSADEIQHRQELMLSIRYRLLLEAPPHVQWTGVESFLLALANRASKDGGAAAEGGADTGGGEAQVVRHPVEVVRAEGAQQKTPAPAKVKEATHHASMGRDMGRDTAVRATKGPDAGRGTAILTMVLAPDEHTLSRASAAESPNLLQVLDGVQRLLGSLRDVDPSVHTFVLASEKIVAPLKAAVVSEPYNTTILPFKPQYRYRGLTLPKGNVARHLVYKETIEKHLLHFARVLILDSKDVVFQAPVSQLFGDGAASPSRGQIFAYQEPVCQQIRAYWENNAAECYKPSFYKSLPDSAIMNGGVLGGAPRALMAVSSLIAEEALKCLSWQSFLRDQLYLDSVLWSISSGLLQHEEATSVHYVRHGTKVVNCNHPKDSEMKVDPSFRVLFRQDDGSWKLPAVLHQYTNREHLLVAAELRAAERHEPVRVRVCAYAGAEPASPPDEEALAPEDAAERALAERWRSRSLAGADCDLWFVPLCGAASAAPQPGAIGLAHFEEHPRRHVYVEPSPACAARRGVAELLGALRENGAIPVVVGGRGAAHEAASPEGELARILAPAILQPSEYRASALQLAAQLSAVESEEDASEHRVTRRPWKQALLMDVEQESGSERLEVMKKMAQSKFCILPRELSPEWLVRAVLAMCIPVLRRQASLPFEDLYPAHRVSIFWAPESTTGLTQFLQRMPAQQLDRMQARLARYRAAVSLREPADGGKDARETLQLALERRWLEIDTHGRGALAAAKQLEARQRAKQLPSAEKPLGRFAYFVSPFDGRFVAGACRLLQSLAEVGTEHPVVIFLLEGADLPQHSLVEVVLCGEGLDLRFKTLSPYEPFPDGQWSGKREGMGAAWSRLRFFQEDSFDRVLQLEVDQVVRSNLDWLFRLPFASRLHAAANCNACEALRERPRAECLRMLRLWRPSASWETVRELWARKLPGGVHDPEARATCEQELRQDDAFNAGVLLYQPDREVFYSMQQRLQGANPADYPYADQDFLNEYFRDDWLSLPEGVNAQVREATELAPREEWTAGIRLIHWVGSPKPWAVNRTWQQLSSPGLSPPQLAWFGADSESAGAAQPHPASSVGAADAAAAACALPKVLMLVCATNTSNEVYSLWRSLNVPAVRLLNVCEEGAVVSTGGKCGKCGCARLPLYAQALGSLPEQERRETLVVVGDAYDALPNFLDLPQGRVAEHLVARYRQLAPACDRLVAQAELTCYVGRPCRIEEARQFSLRKGTGSSPRVFPNSGFVLGRAADVHAMMASILKAVDLVGLDVATLRDQPLLDAFYLARPDAIVLDHQQLIIGSFQATRLNEGGQITQGAENVTEQCRAYQRGRDIGPFVCASESSPLAPCCLKLRAEAPSLSESGCAIVLPEWGSSANAPLFVHGQGPYKDPIRRARKEMLQRCKRSEALPPQPTPWAPSKWWLFPAALLLALACWALYGRARGSGRGRRQQGARPALVCCAAYLALTWITYGFVFGLANATIRSVVEELHLTPWQEGIVVGCPAFVMVLAAQPAGVVAERLGRCVSEQIAALLILGGSMVWGFATSFWSVFGGRCLLGLGLSVGMVASPLHAAEVAPSQLRGALCSSLEVFVNVGIVGAWLLSILLSQTVGMQPSEAWHLVVLASGLLALLCLPASLFLATESPRWLLKNNEIGAARTAFCQLLSSDEELQQTLSTVEGQAAGKKGPDSIRASGQVAGVWRRLREGHLWKPLLVSMTVSYLHHGCGIGILVNFSNQLLAPDFGAAQAERVTVLVGLVKVAALFPALALVDRLGRKPLLTASLALMGLSYAAWALQETFETTSLNLVTLALMANVVAFSMGVGPLNYVIPAEVWPQEYRDVGVASSMLACRLTEGVIAVTFMPLLSYTGGRLSPLLWGFASACMCGSLFFLCYFQETKQQVLESNAMEK